MTNSITDFKLWLTKDEKSASTVAKYLRDVTAFCDYLGENQLCKEYVMEYKHRLTEKYKPAGVNSRLTAINRFLDFIGRPDCRVKTVRIQRQLFANEQRELTGDEYRRLIKASQGKKIGYIMQTVCGTGIRVSELEYITAEAVDLGRAVVNCKNKTRVIFIPAQVCSLLKAYMKKAGITSGVIFKTNSGKPLDRSNIWRSMKNLCAAANVDPDKVFPHNLRHLFARTFYRLKKDIVRLADLLGHSSIETTRIYTVEAGQSHIDSLNEVTRLLLTT